MSGVERACLVPWPHSPHSPAGRPIKRMQIKTFYLNDNITLVDASALA